MNKRKLSNVLSGIWLAVNVIPIPFGGTVALGIVQAIFGLRSNFAAIFYNLCVSVLIFAIVILFCQEKNSEGKLVRYNFPILAAMIVVIISSILFFGYHSVGSF